MATCLFFVGEFPAPHPVATQPELDELRLETKDCCCLCVYVCVCVCLYEEGTYTLSILEPAITGFGLD